MTVKVLAHIQPFFAGKRLRSDITTIASAGDDDRRRALLREVRELITVEHVLKMANRRRCSGARCS